MMQKICVEANIEKIRMVTDQLNEIMDKEGLSEEVKAVVDIAIDEIMSNIIFYSGSKDIEIEYMVSEEDVVLSFKDNGICYNPLDTEQPDIEASATERKIGGLGIFMVKELMDEVAYQYEDGRNILRIKKCVNGTR